MYLIAWWSQVHSAALVALLVPWVKWYLMVSFVGIYYTLVKCISNTMLDQILQKNWAVCILLKDWINKWFFTDRSASCLSVRYCAIPFHVFVRIWHKSIWSWGEFLHLHQSQFTDISVTGMGGHTEINLWFWIVDNEEEIRGVVLKGEVMQWHLNPS